MRTRCLGVLFIMFVFLRVLVPVLPPQATREAVSLLPSSGALRPHPATVNWSEVEYANYTWSASSPHPYPNDYSNSWRLALAGAVALRAFFANCSTEPNYDFVMVEDDAGHVVAEYSGYNKTPFWSPWVEGDVLVVTLSADYVFNSYGFDIAGCQAASYKDSDHDGIPDFMEVMLGTNPFSADTDGDWLGDYAEIYVYHTNATCNDTDHDGLLDGAEVYTYDTNATNPDTDGDGFSDGAEVNFFHSDPLNPLSPALIIWLVSGIAAISGASLVYVARNYKPRSRALAFSPQSLPPIQTTSRPHRPRQERAISWRDTPAARFDEERIRKQAGDFLVRLVGLRKAEMFQPYLAHMDRIFYRVQQLACFPTLEIYVEFFICCHNPLIWVQFCYFSSLKFSIGMISEKFHTLTGLISIYFAFSSLNTLGTWCHMAQNQASLGTSAPRIEVQEEMSSNQIPSPAALAKGVQNWILAPNGWAVLKLLQRAGCEWVDDISAITGIGGVTRVHSSLRALATHGFLAKYKNRRRVGYCWTDAAERNLVPWIREKLAGKIEGIHSQVRAAIDALERDADAKIAKIKEALADFS